MSWREHGGPPVTPAGAQRLRPRRDRRHGRQRAARQGRSALRAEAGCAGRWTRRLPASSSERSLCQQFAFGLAALGAGGDLICVRRRSEWPTRGASTVQPRPEDYDFELDEALASVVGIRTIIPSDAFTAESLGTERAGNGVVIRDDGMVLTIGYLITEAETVWISSGGNVVSGHVLGYDQETGFGLVQALGRLDLPALPLGNSAAAEVGEQVVVGGAGGRAGLGRRPHHRQAGVRRLLGVCAGRGDLHRARASQLGRHRPDRPGRRPDRHRLAADPADGRQPAGRRRQHDRADRPAEADLGGPHHHRPSQPSGAAVARPVRHRDRRQRSRAGAGEPRAGAAGGLAHRRHHHGRGRQRR